MRCERMHGAEFGVEVCLARQKWNDDPNSQPRFDQCIDCEQGRRALKGELDDDRKPEMEIMEGSASGKTKRCCKCKKDVPVEQFSACKANKDGLDKCCMSCKSTYQKGWRAKQRKIREATQQSCGSLEGFEAPHAAIPQEPVRKDVAPVEGQETIAEAVEVVTSESAPLTIVEAAEIVGPIVIDLGKYPALVRRLHEVADQEERTPEGQVRYWLRSILEGAEVRLDG